MLAHLDAIGIVTARLEESLRFYALLGIDVPVPDDDHVEAVLPGGLRMTWDTVDLMRQMDPSWQSPIGHRMLLSFTCADGPALDLVYEQVIAAGFRGVRKPWDAFWGQRLAQLLDPDGNLVDLSAPVPAYD
mgnify:FL=1